MMRLFIIIFLVVFFSGSSSFSDFISVPDRETGERPSYKECIKAIRKGDKIQSMSKDENEKNFYSHW